jgi:hypothetical protein
VFQSTRKGASQKIFEAIYVGFVAVDDKNSKTELEEALDWNLVLFFYCNTPDEVREEKTKIIHGIYKKIIKLNRVMQNGKKISQSETIHQTISAPPTSITTTTSRVTKTKIEFHSKMCTVSISPSLPV